MDEHQLVSCRAVPTWGRLALATISRCIQLRQTIYIYIYIYIYIIIYIYIYIICIYIYIYIHRLTHRN